jgi:hypothetical protein
MPVCFMMLHDHAVRPQADPGRTWTRAVEIDFNALWDRSYVPVIKDLGYEPVRADQDTGALIIGQMLERLYFADLVLADMTIPNGNVYYEVGIRHGAQKSGCVLLAADWSKQLFDVVQMRTVRYPLPEGDITDDTAAGLRPTIKDGIVALRDVLFADAPVDPGLSRRCRSGQGDHDQGPACGARGIPDQGARGARRTAEQAHAARTGAGREGGKSARDLPDRTRIAAAAA